MKAGNNTIIDVSVVIPVYNEQDNVAILHSELKGVLEKRFFYKPGRVKVRGC